MESIRIKDIRSGDVYNGKEVRIEGIVNSIDRGLFLENEEYENPTTKDIGYLTIIQPLESLDTIKIVMKEDMVSPDIWNKIKIGTKAHVYGKLKMDDIKHRQLILYLEVRNFENIGILNLSEKKNIFLDYLKRNFSIIRDKKFYADLEFLGIEREDVPQIIESLLDEKKIHCPKKGEIAILDYFDMLEERQKELEEKHKKENYQVLEIIEKFQNENKEISIEDIFSQANKEGMNNTEQALERLLRDGVIFKPQEGFIRKV